MYISLLKISSLHIFQDHPMLHKEQRRLGKSILQEKNFEVFSTFYFYREVWTPVSVPGDYVLNKLNLSYIVKLW